MLRGLDALGWHHAPLPRDVRGCPQDEQCGYCGFGCRRGAKQSTLITYLQDAYDRGARLIVDTVVKRVILESGRAVGVEAVVRYPQGPRPFKLTVRARAVVVAGGSVHSPALLLRSGLELPALGRHLALHPGGAVFGLMPDAVRPWTGTVQAHYSDQFADLDAGYGFKFETIPVHPSLFALAVPWESRQQHADAMAELDHTSLVAVLVRDREGGRVTVDGDGQPIISYRLSPYDARHLRQGLAAAARVLEAAGARAIWAPHARTIGYRPNGSAAPRDAWLATLDRAGFGPNQAQLATFHQMASCRMGANARTSVVNPEHQVWGVPGLHVADASTFPTSSGVNPMLTIMAMAHRAAGVIASTL
jgi:choline dehydrogenase-like flavoprotein